MSECSESPWVQPCFLCCGAALHFDPSPASQVGGSSSSSSPEVLDLSMKKRFGKIPLLNLPGLGLSTESYNFTSALLFFKHGVRAEA